VPLAQIAVPSLYIIDGKLTKKFHDFKEIFEEFLKKVLKKHKKFFTDAIC